MSSFIDLSQSRCMPPTQTKPGSEYRKRLVRFTLLTLIPALLVTLYGILPVKYANGVAHPGRSRICCQTPADEGFKFEMVEFQSRDGVTLRGWYIPSQNGAAIIVTHGVGENRMGMLKQAAMLARHGYGVLLFDLRAHGESGGEAITFSGEDVLAGMRYLAAHPEIDPGRIGALGASLGGLVSIQAAAGSDGIQALVVDGAGLADFKDEPAPTSLGHLLDLPFQWVAFQVWRLMGVAAPLPVVDALSHISPRPVLLISGTKSAFEKGAMRKFQAAAGPSCTLWEVPEAWHAQAFSVQPEAYEKRVIDFFDHALSK